MSDMNIFKGAARASVLNSEVRGKNKKYTIYKLLVTYQGKTYTHYRRYSDFNKLHELLKKAHPDLHLKFPGKKNYLAIILTRCSSAQGRTGLIPSCKD